MNKRKIDCSEIQKLTAQDFKRGRHFTSQKRGKFAEAYRHAFCEEPPHLGRPFKYANAKLVSVSIRIHPVVLNWAKKEAHKKHVGYQSFLNEFLLCSAV